METEEDTKMYTINPMADVDFTQDELVDMMNYYAMCRLLPSDRNRSGQILKSNITESDYQLIIDALSQYLNLKGTEIGLNSLLYGDYRNDLVFDMNKEFEEKFSEMDCITLKENEFEAEVVRINTYRDGELSSFLSELTKADSYITTDIQGCTYFLTFKSIPEQTLETIHKIQIAERHKHIHSINIFTRDENGKDKRYSVHPEAYYWQESELYRKI